MTLSELKEIIKSKYLHRGDYTLSSGAKSTKYFDIKSMIGDIYDCHKLIEELIWKIRKIECECLGGTELGGALLVAAMLGEVYKWIDTPDNFCFIRKQQRIHGLKKMIEGSPKSPILLVDDVISSTQTTRYAIIECEKAGYKVCGVLCVINRTPLELTSISDVPLYSLFKESDFD